MKTTFRPQDDSYSERVIVVAGVTPDEEDTYIESLAELKELISTASGVVVGELVQKIPHRGQSGYIGSGKLEELAALAAANEADVIACDDELKPSQARNIADAVGMRVVDRTEVILSIFARHAKTREAKLQVELAQLEYLSPRLTHMWSHFWRQTAGFAIGTRGPGEKQLELDRRTNKRRISELKAEMEEVREHRSRVVSSRPGNFNVSIIGYTNSGKSTLLNSLTGADALVENKLFSTLDTKTRAMRLRSGLSLLVSDTVGFIRKLPHHLVESFYATLEETRAANVLVHVVDASSKVFRNRIDSVEEVLSQLGCADKPTILVFNKTDLLDEFDLSLLKSEFADAQFISALHRENLDTLGDAIYAAIMLEAGHITIKVPLADGALVSHVLQSGFAVTSSYDGEFLMAEIIAPREEIGRMLRRGAMEVDPSCPRPPVN